MTRLSCNDSDVKSLQVSSLVGSLQGGGDQAPPYVDDFIIREFKRLPVVDQEKLIDELSNQLHRNVLIEKLPEESEETYRLRCFTELYMMFPLDTLRSFRNAICRRYHLIREFPWKPPFNSHQRSQIMPQQYISCNTTNLAVSSIISQLCEGTAEQIGQTVVDSVVTGELRLELFKIKTLDLRGADQAEHSSTSTSTK